MRRWGAFCLVLLLLAAAVLPCSAERELRHETFVFRTGDEREAAYLIKPASINDGGIRFADASAEIVYCFPLTENDYIRSVELSAALYQQLLLSVSTDGREYTEVYRWVGTVNDNGSGGLEKELRTFDLTPYLDLTEAEEIYVKIADSYSIGGWGGAIHPSEDVVLDITHIVPTAAEKNAAEMRASAHRVPLLGCNEAVEGTFSLDTANANGGSASLRYRFEGGAPSLRVDFAAPVNAEGMDTLTFAWYLSDASLLPALSHGMLILTDAEGTVLSLSMSAVASALSEPQDGWNDVAVPLSAAEGTSRFDLSCVSGCSFVWQNVIARTGAVMRIDTVCLTDDQARARAAALVNVAPLMSICERLDELLGTPMGEANYKESARLTVSAREEADQLSEQDYALAEEVGAIETLQRAESAIRDYLRALDAGTIVPSPDGAAGDGDNGYESIAPPPTEQGTASPESSPSEPSDSTATEEPTEPSGKAPWAVIGVSAAGLAALVVILWTARKKKAKKC